MAKVVGKGRRERMVPLGATEIIRSGASVWAVEELLGHDDLEKLKHYVQLTIDDIKKTHVRS